MDIVYYNIVYQNMVTEDPVDLNLTMSPSSRKIPALLTKNSAQPCQTESYGEIMWFRLRPTDDDDILTLRIVENFRLE